jgi:hypothetical protein
MVLLFLKKAIFIGVKMIKMDRKYVKSEKAGPCSK